MPMIRAALVGLVLIVGLAVPTSAQETSTVVYLVRHAEKQDDGTSDPALNAAGIERVELLDQMLRDAGLTHVHSTDFKRTQTTAGPIASRAGLEVSSYDPRDLPGFATWIRAHPGRHFVAGHSNTTPALVSALGGEAGSAIEEATEYDRLYVVTLGRDGTVSTVLLRFGVAFQH